MEYVKTHSQRAFQCAAIRNHSNNNITIQHSVCVTSENLPTFCNFTCIVFFHFSFSCFFSLFTPFPFLCKIVVKQQFALNFYFPVESLLLFRRYFSTLPFAIWNLVCLSFFWFPYLLLMNILFNLDLNIKMELNFVYVCHIFIDCDFWSRNPAYETKN